MSKILFRPEYTFDCGQAFRWSPIDDMRQKWVGVVNGQVVRATRNRVDVISDPSEEGQKILERYFSPDDDLELILSSLPNDDFLTSAIQRYRGLRLLTQDPWECLVSFVCSINTNIPSIRLKIENLSKRFGKKIPSILDFQFYSFPDASSLAKANVKELLECRVGFRWKYISFIAKEVSSGELDLDSLSNVPYIEAQKELVSEISGSTFGVGPKVADCTLLFSLHKTEAFPIDVWMMRCLGRNYSELLGNLVDKKSLTTRTYYLLSEAMRAHFGKYAGYAQQYLYMKTRSEVVHSK